MIRYFLISLAIACALLILWLVSAWQAGFWQFLIVSYASFALLLWPFQVLRRYLRDRNAISERELQIRWHRIEYLKQDFAGIVLGTLWNVVFLSPGLLVLIVVWVVVTN